MKRVIVLCAAACAFLAPTTRGTASAEEYFQQFVHYTIKARLDTEKHMLTGSERILYRNNSPDTLRLFYLHLYPNAYKSKNTQFIKDFRRGFNFTLLDIPEKHRGFLDLENVRVEGRKTAVEVDETIAKIELPAPLLPGDSMVVEMNFREKVRRHLGRAGYEGKHYDMAQWYPKVVVYDENGFHPDIFRTGEFYGEFGTFDVILEVPDDFVVAATGVPVEGDPGWRLNPVSGGDGKHGKRRSGKYKSVHFHAENVHDFAWSADPEFVVQDTTWNGVSIKSFYRKKHAKTWKDSTLVHGVRAIKWLSEKIGMYPYPQVSIVDALLGGGMEYPMLVMDGRASEGLVLHEVGHIYFYGIFGNDERAEAWLDEGFTTFQTIWYMNEKYGPWGKKDDWNLYKRITPQYTLFQGRRLAVAALQRLGYAERVATRAEDFVHSYRVNVYNKASLMYNALRYVVGEEKFDEILHEYFKRWGLHHVNEERFRKVCEDVSGMDLGWFFKEWLHSTKACDYELADMKVTEKGAGKGYKAEIVVKRLGEIVMPLRLEIACADGTVETFRIDGKLRTIRRSFDLESKPVGARLNPGNEILDLDLSNNFIPRRHDFRFDWPGNDHHPEDAYEVRWRPASWYNDIDGLKAGLHVRGSYMGWSRRFSLGVYYGFESERVDFSASLSKRLRILGDNGEISLSGYKMEGRQDAELRISLRRRKKLLYPPNHDFTIGFRYHELRDSRFADEEEYQEGGDLGPFVGYTVDPQFDVMSTRLSVALELGRKWMGGEYKYERFTGSLIFKTRRSVIPAYAGLRLFLGLAGGDTPYQRKFHLAGAGPLERERRFYLRSPGAVPEDLHYHQGGDGNLRGYLAGDFGVNKLFALNLELKVPLPLPLLDKITSRLVGRLHATAFFDLGRSFDDDNPIATSLRTAMLVDDGYLGRTLMDAGLGVEAGKRFPFYNLKLRVDFPLYVSTPEINGETKKTDFRYVFSLGSSF